MIAGQRLLIIYVRLPIYFRSETITAYEELNRRFGKLSRLLISVLTFIAAK